MFGHFGRGTEMPEMFRLRCDSHGFPIFFSLLLPLLFFFLSFFLYQFPPRHGRVCQSCDLLACLTALTHQVTSSVCVCVCCTFHVLSFQAILGSCVSRAQTRLYFSFWTAVDALCHPTGSHLATRSHPVSPEISQTPYVTPSLCSDYRDKASLDAHFSQKLLLCDVIKGTDHSPVVSDNTYDAGVWNSYPRWH